MNLTHDLHDGTCNASQTSSTLHKHFRTLSLHKDYRNKSGVKALNYQKEKLCQRLKAH